MGINILIGAIGFGIGWLVCDLIMRPKFEKEERMILDDLNRFVDWSTKMKIENTKIDGKEFTNITRGEIDDGD